MKTKSNLTTVSVPWLKTGDSHNWFPHVPSVCLGLIKSEIRRVQVEPHHVILPVLAGLELLWAAFHQALVLQKTRWHLHSHPATMVPIPGTTVATLSVANTHHVLPLGQDLEQRIVPFQDVDIQQMPRGEGPAAEGAGVSM